MRRARRLVGDFPEGTDKRNRKRWKRDRGKEGEGKEGATTKERREGEGGLSLSANTDL